MPDAAEAADARSYGQPRKLLIAIPALNEEQSIAGVIERALRLRDSCRSIPDAPQIEITVVSDGSTDGTTKIAERYTGDIRLIVFPENRGYGAAIKAAWMASDADYLGFLDADGTCDPEVFLDLSKALESEHADVVIGSRVGPNTRMPMIRRAGNMLFASLLSLLSSERVHDAASGMRVIRRSSLPKLMPLPDGLHFTPAMSARAILSDELKIIEVPMPYSEREGRSKLSVLRDGMRFLRVIVQSALLYRPSRPLALCGVGCIAAAIAWMLYPVTYYISEGSLLEWMIYRFLVSDLLGSTGVLFFCASYLSRRIVGITLRQTRESLFYRSAKRFFNSAVWWITIAALLAVGGLLVFPALLELVRTGHVFEHWSRFVAMSFFAQVALILGITKLFDHILELIASQLEFLSAASG